MVQIIPLHKLASAVNFILCLLKAEDKRKEPSYLFGLSVLATDFTSTAIFLVKETISTLP